jgi:hypothetical protein
MTITIVTEPRVATAAAIERADIGVIVMLLTSEQGGIIQYMVPRPGGQLGGLYPLRGIADPRDIEALVGYGVIEQPVDRQALWRFTAKGLCPLEVVGVIR